MCEKLEVKYLNASIQHVAKYNDIDLLGNPIMALDCDGSLLVYGAVKNAIKSYCKDGKNKNDTEIVVTSGNPIRILLNKGNGFPINDGLTIGTSKYLVLCDTNIIDGYNNLVSSLNTVVALDVAYAVSDFDMDDCGKYLFVALVDAVRQYSCDWKLVRTFSDVYLSADYSISALTVVGCHVFVGYNTLFAGKTNYIVVFDFEGNIVRRIVTADTSFSFYKYKNYLLVLNTTRDICVYELKNLEYLGKFRDNCGSNLVVPGCLCLAVDNCDKIYFSSAIGSITRGFSIISDGAIGFLK